ncbi:hypothetical protein [Kitasatospora sp. NPDC047058]|uniref:hypothetical protein n=1 Tax=Kitasatospora sp. NPDC047058 TaxID=3155620 RepID=UPI0033DCF5B1
MPELWMPGAEIHDIGDHAPTDGGPAKAIAHITWDKNATASAPQDWVSFDSLVNYFTGSGQGSAPHIIWDPFTGRVAQLHPANSRSKSVVDSTGGTRTNRAGSVVIQIEAVFFPYCRYQGRVYPRLADTPCAGWDRLNAWVLSWGVPDTWPMGKPVDFSSHRDEATWETQAGWYAHAHVPENDHQDPGSWPTFTTANGPQPTPSPSEEDDMPSLAEIDTLIQQRLAAERDMTAHATLYWLTVAYGGLQDDPGTHPLAAVIPALRNRLAALPNQVWSHKLPHLRDDWTKDGDLEAFWYVAGKDVSDRATERSFAELKALLSAQGAAITALAQQVAAGTPVDPDELVARIQAAIAGIEIHLTTAGTPAPTPKES